MGVNAKMDTLLDTMLDIYINHRVPVDFQDQVASFNLMEVKRALDERLSQAYNDLREGHYKINRFTYTLSRLSELEVSKFEADLLQPYIDAKL